MDIMSYISRKGWLLLALAFAYMTVCSCNGVIYDDEGDCTPHYRVKFRYDYNMKFADAFAHEVNMVTLYLLDGNDSIVWQRTERGEALAADGYAIAIDGDIPPGKYSLTAWCGTDDKRSFVVSDGDKGRQLTCRLNREHDAGGGAFVDKDIDRLFYGRLDNLTFSGDEGVYTYTVPLVKNTNNIRVVLQNLTEGEEIDADRFSFFITSDNGFMDWDNSLIADETVTYHAWYTETASADFDGGTGEELTAAPATRQTAVGMQNAVVAELTISRLVKGRETRLVIVNNETGVAVLNIPLTDYALLVKGYYNRDMGDQEFLDRQDVFDLVFFLKNGNWLGSQIYINSWRIVLQDTEL